MKKKSIPTTTREAFKILDGMLTEEEKQDALSKSRSQFAGDEHFGLGMWIRNEWYFANDRKWNFGYNDEAFAVLPDMLSQSLLERYHDHLKRKYRKQNG